MFRVKVQEILNYIKKVGRDQSLTVTSNTRTKDKKARSGFKIRKRNKLFMQVDSTCGIPSYCGYEKTYMGVKRSQTSNT